VRNIIAVLPGTEEPDEVLVCCAHYDSIPGSPGANDNASGVAAVLEMARMLAREKPQRTWHFLLFAAEEIGLQGSDFYVRSLGQKESMVAVINLDCVAHGDKLVIETRPRTRPGESGPSGSGTRVEQLKSLCLERAAEDGFAMDRWPEGCSSDHSAFVSAGIPAFTVSAMPLGAIHSPDDNMENIEVEMFQSVFRYAWDLALELDVHGLAEQEAPARPSLWERFLDWLKEVFQWLRRGRPQPATCPVPCLLPAT